MADEYALLAQLKTWMGITTTDVDRDALLTLALTSASRFIDEHCGRRFFLDPSATERTFVTSSGGVLLLDDIGDEAGVLVTTGTVAAPVAVTDFDLLPRNAIARGWAAESISSATWAAGVTVRVTARWGWPAIPDQIVQATLIEAARIYKRKDSPEGVAGSSDWGAIRISRADPEVVALLAPFRFTKVA